MRYRCNFISLRNAATSRTRSKQLIANALTWTLTSQTRSFGFSFCRANNANLHRSRRVGPTAPICGCWCPAPATCIHTSMASCAFMTNARPLAPQRGAISYCLCIIYCSYLYACFASYLFCAKFTHLHCATKCAFTHIPLLPASILVVGTRMVITSYVSIFCSNKCLSCAHIS